MSTTPSRVGRRRRSTGSTTWSATPASRTTSAAAPGTGAWPAPAPGLRNHIPLGAPATREPVDGTEGFLRVSLGFTPRWYRARLGTDFPEPWHADPAYRAGSLLAMKRPLHACFPTVPYFRPVMDDGLERTCWTLSGVNGIMTVPRLYGIEPRFVSDGWPDARDGLHLPQEAIPMDRPVDPGDAAGERLRGRSALDVQLRHEHGEPRAVRGVRPSPGPRARRPVPAVRGPYLQLEGGPVPGVAAE